MSWKFADETRLIVSRDLPGGGIDSRSVHDAEVRAWLDAGNTPSLADHLPSLVPQEVTMRQARRALLAAGLLTAVETAINTLPEPTRSAALIDWNHSNTVHRTNGFVAQLTPLLGLTAAQLDALFIAAAGYAA